jgi:hypothetical protein
MRCTCMLDSQGIRKGLRSMFGDHESHYLQFRLSILTGVSLLIILADAPPPT